MTTGADELRAIMGERPEGCERCRHFEDANDITKVLRGPRDGFCYEKGVTVMKYVGRRCHDFDPLPATNYWRPLL